jgi:hypothetical protein
MGYVWTLIFDYQRSPISKTSAGQSVSHLIRLSLPNTMWGGKRAINYGDGGMSSNCLIWSGGHLVLRVLTGISYYLPTFGIPRASSDGIRPENAVHYPLVVKLTHYSS